MEVIRKVSELKVAAIRVLYRDCQKLQLKGGHLEKYHIMEVKI
jgi:hypothetical protein